MHVLETVFKVVGGAFLLLHPKSFYTNNENHLNSEKNGSIGKKLSLFYNNPSIIADQCHESNLLEQEFQYQKKNVSLQLSQHPLKILNGCNIYRTSALLVIMKKGKEETKT